MRKSIALALTAIALLAISCERQVEQQVTRPFDGAEFVNNVMNAWNNKDLKMVEGYLSDLYNEVGTSKQEALKAVADIFERYDKISCRYRVMKFKHHQGTDLAYIRAILDLKGIPKGGQDYVKIVQTMGYASLIFENGRWKIYATQFYTSPQIPNFDFDKERGIWPAWGAQIDLASYDPAQPLASGEARADEGFVDASNLGELAEGPRAFNKAAFEARVVNGWNRKDAKLIGSYLSRLYNEIGVSRNDLLRQVNDIFARYDEISCRYRVLAFKRFPDSDLASIKAVMEVKGKPAGSGEFRNIVQTMGYASLIFEDGDWKVYATQIFASPEISNFNFEQESGDWPPWNRPQT